MPEYYYKIMHANILKFLIKFCNQFNYIRLIMCILFKLANLYLFFHLIILKLNIFYHSLSLYEYFKDLYLIVVYLYYLTVFIIINYLFMII